MEVPEIVIISDPYTGEPVEAYFVGMHNYYLMYESEATGATILLLPEIAREKAKEGCRWIEIS
jgi:hypothetical protein